MSPHRTVLQIIALGATTGVLAAALPAQGRLEGNTKPMAPHNHVARDTTSSGYTIDDVGTFNSHFSFDFTTLSTLPSPLVASTYTVGAGTAPYARQFNESNIIVESGEALKMLVPGGQTTSPIESAQMTTSYDDVLYASVRTVAKASSVSGVIHGFFMYYDDNQETDIEIQTADLSLVHFTNQAVSSGVTETTNSTSAPSDISTAFHEYRYDWLSDRCDFYIDSVLQSSFTDNVPSSAGYLMWNQWSNGNTWSMGPPAEDSYLEIQSIDAYFNRTSVTDADSTATDSEADDDSCDDEE